MPGVPALAATADEVLVWLRDDRKLKQEVLDVSISAPCRVCVWYPTNTSSLLVVSPSRANPRKT